MRLQDFIKIYDDVFSDEECEELINEFNVGEQEFIDEDKRPKFTQVTLSEEKSKSIISKLNNPINDYCDFCDVSEYMLPETFAYELARIKKYRNGSDDQFKEHVDVRDYGSSRRFMSFLIYLNDVEVGGETRFINIQKKVRPKRGRLLIFPPLWLFPHMGAEVQSGDKYILSTYLHYL